MGTFSTLHRALSTAHSGAGGTEGSAEHIERDPCTAAVQGHGEGNLCLSPAGTAMAEISSLASEPGESSHSLSSEQPGRKDREI